MNSYGLDDTGFGDEESKAEKSGSSSDENISPKNDEIIEIPDDEIEFEEEDSPFGAAPKPSNEEKLKPSPHKKKDKEIVKPAEPVKKEPEIINPKKSSETRIQFGKRKLTEESSSNSV